MGTFYWEGGNRHARIRRNGTNGNGADDRWGKGILHNAHGGIRSLRLRYGPVSQLNAIRPFLRWRLRSPSLWPFVLRTYVRGWTRRYTIRRRPWTRLWRRTRPRFRFQEMVVDFIGAGEGIRPSLCRLGLKNKSGGGDFYAKGRWNRSSRGKWSGYRQRPWEGSRHGSRKRSRQNGRHEARRGPGGRMYLSQLWNYCFPSGGITLQQAELPLVREITDEKVEVIYTRSQKG